MNGRLEHVIVGSLFVSAAAALFLVVALLVKLIFKKNIGTAKYFWIAGLLGTAVFGALLSVAPKSEYNKSTASAPSLPVDVTAAGLDAPLIAPPEDKMESFVGQLNSAVAQLSPTDKTAFIEAMSFLAYVATDYIRDSDPARFAKWDQKDAAAYSLYKMYNFARQNGDKMTLRKYLLLADQIKQQKPELFKQYTALSKQP